MPAKPETIERVLGKKIKVLLVNSSTLPIQYVRVESWIDYIMLMV